MIQLFFFFFSAIIIYSCQTETSNTYLLLWHNIEFAGADSDSASVEMIGEKNNSECESALT